MSVDFEAADLNNMIEILYEEAAQITRNKDTNVEGIEFVKLAVSSTLLIMNDGHRELLSSALSESQIYSINRSCKAYKETFKGIKIHEEVVDALFDEALKFQSE